MHYKVGTSGTSVQCRVEFDNTLTHNVEIKHRSKEAQQTIGKLRGKAGH